MPDVMLSSLAFYPSKLYVKNAELSGRVSLSDPPAVS